jgi:phage tail-like protein
MMHGQLTVRLGNRIILVSPLTRDKCTVGRQPDNDVVLPHHDVSAHHAEIRVETQGIMLTDLESGAGTVLNGTRLTTLQPSSLQDGATIEIGPYSILFRSEDERARHIPRQTTVKRIDRTRPEEDASKPDGAGSSYLQYLPTIFQGDTFLAHYLRIFEAIWEPLERRQDHIAMYFDPQTCPSTMLPWFAGWFGLTLDPHWAEEHQRALLFETIELYRWRGTKFGLARMIEVCTGLKPEITELPGEPFVFRIRVNMPERNPAMLNYLDELIRAHKPAHTGYLLEVL